MILRLNLQNGEVQIMVYDLATGKGWGSLKSLGKNRMASTQRVERQFRQ